MIGLITQNNICRAALLDLLKPLDVEAFNPDKIYQAVLVTDVAAEVPAGIPIITLGISRPDEQGHIESPLHPVALVRQIRSICRSLQDKVTFENRTFRFQKDHRMLTLKRSGAAIALTEKENDLLSALAAVCPQALSKENLLQSAWNYKPDVESHTVESHIYLLRQKLGDDADQLIKSTPTGYTLVTD